MLNLVANCRKFWFQYVGSRCSNEERLDDTDRLGATSLRNAFLYLVTLNILCLSVYNSETIL